MNHLKSFSCLLAVTTILSACGGGGSGSGMMPQTPTSGAVTQPSTPNITVQVSETKTLSSEDLLAFLQISASGGPWYTEDIQYSHHPGLVRFESTPMVRIAESTSDEYRTMIHHAVGMINHALPYDKHILIGDDGKDNASIDDDIVEGEIYITFAPYGTWNVENLIRDYSAGVSQSRDEFEYDQEEEQHYKVKKIKGHVWLDSERSDLVESNRTTAILVHELIHAIGFSGHTDPDEYPESYIQSRGNTPFRDKISDTEVAAIQILYTQLDVGTRPDDLTIDSFGPWDDQKTEITGTFGAMQFGVYNHNGINVPWMDGVGDRILSDNRSLIRQGSGTWNGELVGFTNDVRPVRGDAEIQIQFDTMNGQARFSELQSWNVGITPGDLGTGEQWNTGSLTYDIMVNRNYLRSTGGDEGVVHGRFHDSNHRGVTGTVERMDLTAAFGASR